MGTKTVDAGSGVLGTLFRANSTVHRKEEYIPNNTEGST